MKNNVNNLIYGRNPVKEAIKAKRAMRAYVSPSFSDKETLELLKNNYIPKVTKQNQELAALSNGGVHQGIVCEIKPYEYMTLENLISITKDQVKPIVVILDGINDPHNFGAIIRCAEIFGVSGIIIGKHHQVPLNATVAKTSAGAINYVPIVLVNNLNQAIETLKNNRFWIVSADGSGKTSYLDLKYDFPTALVIGSEGEGISSLTLKKSDYVVKIPMYGQVNSLNASVACGILLAKIKG